MLSFSPHLSQVDLIIRLYMHEPKREEGGTAKLPDSSSLLPKHLQR